MIIKHWRKILCLAGLFIFITSPSPGKNIKPQNNTQPKKTIVAGPLGQMKAKFDQVADTMNSSANKNKKEKRVSKIADEIIDYEEIVGRALARHKNEFTPAQLKKLAGLFAKLVKGIYFDRLYNNWTPGIQIEYKKPKIFVSKTSGNKYALIQSVIQRPQGNIIIDYRLIIKPSSKDGLWRIYDISVEGVSVVKNYRSQFNSILIKINKKDDGWQEKFIKTLKK